jgi:hypothetical protein
MPGAKCRLLDFPIENNKLLIYVIPGRLNSDTPSPIGGGSCDIIDFTASMAPEASAWLNELRRSMMQTPSGKRAISKTTQSSAKFGAVSG